MNDEEFFNMDDDSNDFESIELTDTSAAPDSVSIFTLEGHLMVGVWSEELGEPIDFRLSPEKVDEIVLFLLTHKNKAIASAKGAAQ